MWGSSSRRSSAAAPARACPHVSARAAGFLKRMKVSYPGRSVAVVLDVLFPLTCPGCGGPGAPLCARCLGGLRAPVPAPPPAGIDAWGPPSPTEGAARELVARVKYRNVRAVVPWLAGATVAAVPSAARASLPGVVTWAPTGRDRRRHGASTPPSCSPGRSPAGWVPAAWPPRPNPRPRADGSPGDARRRGPRFVARRAVRPHVCCWSTTSPPPGPRSRRRRGAARAGRDHRRRGHRRADATSGNRPYTPRILRRRVARSPSLTDARCTWISWFEARTARCRPGCRTARAKVRESRSSPTTPGGSRSTSPRCTQAHRASQLCEITVHLKKHFVKAHAAAAEPEAALDLAVDKAGTRSPASRRSA